MGVVHWRDKRASGTVWRMPILLALTLLLAPPPGYKSALNEGQNLTKTGEYAKAAAAFDRALTALIKDACPMSGRGFAHLKSSDKVAAKRDFEQALRWAKTPNLQRIIRYNLKLGSRGPAGAAAVDGGNEEGQSFPGWKALYLGLISESMELLEGQGPVTDQATRDATCEDVCKKAAPWVIKVGGMGLSTFDVTRPGPSGAPDMGG